jgi:hypothetical protein
VSLSDWVKSENVLVLGHDHVFGETLGALNRVIVQRLVELVLNLKENPDTHTWVFLDELRALGLLERLKDLLAQGRSKGCHIVLGFQDLDGLKAVYGDNVTQELIAMCGMKAILRLEGPSTAEWASRLLGEYELRKVKVTYSTSAKGEQSVSEDPDYVEKGHAVLPSEFLAIPPPSFASGLSGYYLAPGPGAWNVDLAVYKNFKIAERTEIRFSADFFNFFNHPNDLNPNTTTGLQDLSRQANTPRTIQFSLRVDW